MAALMPGRGYPLGLGEIDLKSALNQELDAEVQVLSAEPADAEQLIIKLASREAFARAGIDRPFLLTQLKFKIIVKNDKPYVKIYTQNPIKEPFLSFLLDVDWPEGHLLREYTLLLDPPVFSGMTSPSRTEDSGRPFIDPADQTQNQYQSGSQSRTMDGRPAQYDAPSPRATDRYVESGSRPATSDRPMMAGSTSQVIPQPAVIKSETSQRRVTYQPMPQYTQASGDYRVQSKDTLWSIANRFRANSGVSVEQMMLALVRENPEAFIKENINGVKRGYILRMPNREQMTRIDRQQALAQVKQHTALWREYRQALTGSRPASALESQQTASADSMKADATDGKLSIVSASDDVGSETASAGQEPNAELRRLRSQLAMAREALESERLEKEGIRARLADLEQRVESVLQMDDSELAKLQQDLKGAREQADSPAPVIDTMEQPLLEEPVMEEPVVEEMTEQPTPTELSEQEMAAMPEDSAAEDEPIFVDETTPADEVAAPPVVAPAPVTPSAEAPAFVQSQPKTYIESLLDDPKMLATAGGLLSVIALLIAMIMRRRRVNKEETEWVDLGDDTGNMDNFDAEAEFGSSAVDENEFMDDINATTEMKTADLDKTQVDASVAEKAGTDLSDTVMGLADDQLDTDEDKDDVISEADVYLAYGIYQQAEDLLKDAIAKNPDRDDYRLKLLETHYAAKNSDEFVALAEEVQKRKGSDKSYWDRVVAMGSELSPSSALFSGAGAAVVATEDLLPKKPESADLDLGDEDDLELGLDDLLDEDASDQDKTMIMSQPLGLDDELDLDNELDLGDDLDSFTDDATSATEDVAAADDMEFDLGDFDAELDMGASEEPASATASSADDSMDLDDSFSLDFDAADLGFDEDEASAESSASTDDTSAMDLDSDLDLAMDFDTDTSGSSADEDDMGLELDDFSLDLDSEPEAVADEDEGGLELDMGSSEELDASLSLDTGATDTGDDDFDISELSEDIDEVSTKLELARAYIDMGDKEGAKSILEEVKQEGNGDQQSRAEELLQEAS
ncbi:MAG: LysM peptidoglycan-binding domain-containing protein [Gammaproteobacteria bacterium]|nr:LysM peptidoglycan-binding domain-containing protein [Gammaproteobacteria bacterium]